MAEEAKQTGWWQTLPGILTAIAGILTAVGGLVLVLHQTGLLGKPAEGAVSKTTEPAKPIGTVAEKNQPKDQATAPQPAGPMKPWAQAQAKITSKDGSITNVRANSLVICYSGAGLNLLSGQEIKFELMKGFEVLRADPDTSGAQAEIVITLVDGRSIKAQVAANCTTRGHNDLGEFTTNYQKIQRIEFQR